VEDVLAMLAAGERPEQSSPGIHGSGRRTSRPAWSMHDEWSVMSALNRF
jgi:hypothetical protein